MSFFALLAALLLEHFRPLPRVSRLYTWYSDYVHYLERQFNAGEHRHGVLAWFLALSPFVILVTLISIWLYNLSGLMGWAWSVLALYFLMGFGTLGEKAAAVSHALRNQQLDQARMLLAHLRGGDSTDFSASEVARLGIEEILVTAYRRLFGVILWFVLLGPGGGAVLSAGRAFGPVMGSVE